MSPLFIIHSKCIRSHAQIAVESRVVSRDAANANPYGIALENARHPIGVHCIRGNAITQKKTQVIIQRDHNCFFVPYRTSHAV
jgi:hypothetical protein